MRLFVLLTVFGSLSASAQWWPRNMCATNGMSCKPGPCCAGTTCDSLGICRAPEKEWSTGRNPNEPGPDDPPKKKVVESKKKK